MNKWHAQQQSVAVDVPAHAALPQSPPLDANAGTVRQPAASDTLWSPPWASRVRTPWASRARTPHGVAPSAGADRVEEEPVAVIRWLWLVLSGHNLTVAGALGLFWPPADTFIGSTIVSNLYVIFFGVLLLWSSMFCANRPSDDFSFILKPFYQLLLIIVGVNLAWGCGTSYRFPGNPGWLDPAALVGVLTAAFMDILVLYTAVEWIRVPVRPVSQRLMY